MIELYCFLSSEPINKRLYGKRSYAYTFCYGVKIGNYKCATVLTNMNCVLHINARLCARSFSRLIHIKQYSRSKHYSAVPTVPLFIMQFQILTLKLFNYFYIFFVEKQRYLVGTVHYFYFILSVDREGVCRERVLWSVLMSVCGGSFITKRQKIL